MVSTTEVYILKDFCKDTNIRNKIQIKNLICINREMKSRIRNTFWPVDGPIDDFNS